MTIKDPVEYIFPPSTIQTNEAVRLTFTTGPAPLRQDPDIILVAEIQRRGNRTIAASPIHWPPRALVRFTQRTPFRLHRFLSMESIALVASSDHRIVGSASFEQSADLHILHPTRRGASVLRGNRGPEKRELVPAKAATLQWHRLSERIVSTAPRTSP